MQMTLRSCKLSSISKNNKNFKITFRQSNIWKNFMEYFVFKSSIDFKQNKVNDEKHVNEFLIEEPNKIRRK